MVPQPMTCGASGRPAGVLAVEEAAPVVLHARRDGAGGRVVGDVVAGDLAVAEGAEQQRDVDRVQRAEPRVGRRRGRSGRGGRGRPPRARSRAQRSRGLARTGCAVSARDLLVGRVAAAGAQQERRLVARRADEHRDVEPRVRARRAARRAARRRASAARRRACRAHSPSRSSASWRRRRPRPALARSTARARSQRARRGGSLRGLGQRRRVQDRLREQALRGRGDEQVGDAAPRPPTGRRASRAPGRRRTRAISRCTHSSAASMVEQAPVAERASRASRAGS